MEKIRHFMMKPNVSSYLLKNSALQKVLEKKFSLKKLIMTMKTQGINNVRLVVEKEGNTHAQ